jgi:hypothetical protein
VRLECSGKERKLEDMKREFNSMLDGVVRK